eukprot:symbB.v1.2.027617.t1/scaffold2845.1/size69024/5
MATRSMRPVLLPLALLAAIAAPAFTGMSRATPRTRIPRAADNFIPLDAIEPAVSSYVNIWTPLFKSAQESGLAPEFLIHWGHAGAMATVLLAMGGYGTFLGWSTRLGNGSTVYPLSLGQTAAALHPQLMGLALFLFFLGGQGGLVLLATQGQPILQSAHSSTAVIGLGLMAVQAALGVTMGESSEKRTIHAVLGTSVMLVLLVHLFYGLNLGFSI